MVTAIGELGLAEAAKAAAGNWRKFDCFAWHRESKLHNPDAWSIIYTHHRDSGLLDQSNAEAIGEALERFTLGNDPDVVPEHHSHWAVGWIAGFSIRVFKRGRITKAFSTYRDIMERLSDYPLLDDTDYSRREYEATLENIADAAWRLKRDFELPEGWEMEVHRWFSDNDDSAIENRDDQGGYPSEDELRAAFSALGFKQLD